MGSTIFVCVIEAQHWGQYGLPYHGDFYRRDLSIVYSRLFHHRFRIHVPFINIGILIWTYISSVITESKETFLMLQRIYRRNENPIFFIYFSDDLAKFDYFFA